MVSEGEHLSLLPLRITQKMWEWMLLQYRAGVGALSLYSVFRVDGSDHPVWLQLKDFFECPTDTKHLYNICTTPAQRLRRWSSIVQMLYKCFVFFAGWWRQRRCAALRLAICDCHHCRLLSRHGPQSKGQHHRLTLSVLISEKWLNSIHLEVLERKIKSSSFTTIAIHAF